MTNTAPETLTLTLPTGQVQAILEALSQAPYALAAPVIDAIQTQAREQLEA